MIHHIQPSCESTIIYEVNVECLTCANGLCEKQSHELHKTNGIKVLHTKSSENLAYLLKKLLPVSPFERCIREIMMMRLTEVQNCMGEFR